MAATRSGTLPMAADLYGDLEPSPKATWRDHVPGLVIVAAGTLAAGFISDHYGAPLTLMSLLIGLALNFLSADARLTPGLGFASRSLLRWGIVLVGLRVTFGQIVALGPVALLAVLVIVAVTIGCGVLVGRRLGFDAAFGTLAGGAVAICGASAAMALAMAPLSTVSALIPTRVAPTAANSEARSRKWQASFVHPGVMAAG